MSAGGSPLVGVDVGDVIADKYRVDRVLGKGAMGVVVAATHLELRRPRAIKFMMPDATEDRESVERFLREARAAAELKSQHAVKIHDIARLPTGEPYIVMELLEGTDFRALLKQRRALPAREAVAYMLQACEAVAEAHAAGIVHRDLKPANLFLASGALGASCVKVLDFGIAKLNDKLATEEEAHLTSTYTVMGSPLYMSPEQILSTRSVDARSDIWSLGVILYNLVTGQLPFGGESATAVFAAVQRDPPPPPTTLRPDIPPGLERVILRCLEKEPARRFASVAELASALAPFAPSGTRTSFSEAAPPDVSETQVATNVWRPAVAQTGPSSGSYPGAPAAGSGSWPGSASQSAHSGVATGTPGSGSWPSAPASGSWPSAPASGSWPGAQGSGGWPAQTRESSPSAQSSSGAYAPYGSEKGGTYVMNQPPASGPRISPGEMTGPGAQTNSPMVQSLKGTATGMGEGTATGMRSRSREVVLAASGFGAALVVVGIVVALTRGGGGSEAKPAADTASATSIGAAGAAAQKPAAGSPVVTAVAPAPDPTAAQGSAAPAEDAQSPKKQGGGATTSAGAGAPGAGGATSRPAAPGAAPPSQAAPPAATTAAAPPPAAPGTGTSKSVPTRRRDD